MPFSKGLMGHAKMYKRKFPLSNGKFKGLIANQITP
jgi:hypothetical protein